MHELSDLDQDNKAFRQLKNRSKFLLFLITLILGFTFFQIIKLTLLDTDLYITKSNENRIILLPIYPSRGLIKISDEQVIVENIVLQALSISPNKTKDLEKTLLELKQTLKLKDQDISSFRRKLKEQNSQYLKLTLSENLSQEQISKYSVYKDRWPSTSVEAQLVRYSIFGSLFSHVTGYVGPVSKQEWEESKDFPYSFDFMSGKTGVEKHYEKVLRGQIGYKTVEVDVHGKEVRELERYLPKKAKDLHLGLDRELQMLSRYELAGRRGAIVAMDPNSGLIKALVSSPDFNPNVLNKTEKGSILNLLNDSEGPLFNRAISGSYPPASTLKPFIGLLGLKEQVIDWSLNIEDKGYFQLEEEGRRYRGWKEEGHGLVNLNKAIIESSDIYFYELATQLTVDRISDFLKQFGFGLETGIDLFSETKGILPDRNWKLGTIGESWFVGDTINISIGQGYISCSPLQLAVAISTIATKGKAYRPRVVEKIGEEFTKKELIYDINQIEEYDWNKLQSSLVSVTTSWNGTAYNLSTFAKEKIAGKTGTAQIKSLTDQDLTAKEEYKDIRLEEKNRDHALFAGYGPIPDPKLTVVVIVENGESGSAIAAPIAQKLIDFYTNRGTLDE